jgi:hypothetical protein
LSLMEKRQEYRRKVREARARERPPMPSAVTPPYVVATEIERAYCKPEEVEVRKSTVTPEGAKYVQLTCPKRGGATRERTFTADELKCYFDTVEKMDGTGCQKVDAALVCADHVTSTLTEQLTGGDVSRGEASKCLLEDLDKGEASAEYTWTKYKRFPLRTPRISSKQLHDKRLGEYFAGEPIYTATPEKKEKMKDLLT